ncbi:hypothetical protein KSP40_PGU012208 [Platanthera guangdongensis]|uniref:Secreted protein n=1 Tax=Platanthera guangdongensis TaxID=2320717 RepID=A0ABR2M5J0_9ASPA
MHHVCCLLLPILTKATLGGLFAFGQDGEDLLADPSLPSYGRCSGRVSDFLCGSQGLSFLQGTPLALVTLLLEFPSIRGTSSKKAS